MTIPSSFILPSLLRAWPRRAAGVIALGLLAALPVVQAGQYGSASPFTFTGTYTLPDSVSTTTLSNGNTQDKVTWKVVRVTSADVLREMEERGLFHYGAFLFASAAEFRLTLVARSHHADGVAFFATSPKYPPIPVPTDLLTFVSDDGPMNGSAVVNPDALLVSLRRSTCNSATLTRPGLVANGAVRKTWTSALKQNPDWSLWNEFPQVEAVELASGTGRVTGPVTVDEKTGVAELTFLVGKPAVVDLTPYGMAVKTGSSIWSGGASGSFSFLFVQGDLILSSSPPVVNP